MRPRNSLLLAAVVALIVPAVPATSLQPRTLPELVREADQVVHGRVISARAVPDDTRIFTEYVVEVRAWAKTPGAEPSTITIRQPGGTWGDVTMTVVGAAHFAPGQELVLFTRDYGGRGHQQVVNLQQGALAVLPAASLAPGAPPGRTVPQAARLPGGGPEDLDTLLSLVRRLVAVGATP